MVTLSVDPGIRNVGYCINDVVDEKFIYLSSGYLDTGAKTTVTQRLKTIHDHFSNLIQLCKVTALSYEQPNFNRGVNGFNVIKAEGVLLLLAGLHNLTTTSYSPKTIKKTLTGTGTAGKEDVEKSVNEFLNLKLTFTTDHESDACGVAITNYKITKGQS